MKTQRPYPALAITPKGERALVDGHPWVYAGEVTQVPEGTEDGALVDVLSRKGSYLGTGFYNSRLHDPRAAPLAQRERPL